MRGFRGCPPLCVLPTLILPFSLQREKRPVCMPLFADRHHAIIEHPPHETKPTACSKPEFSRWIRPVGRYERPG